MRILWICGAAIIGGAERTSLQMAVALRARGHELHVLHRAGSRLESKLAAAGLTGHPAPLGGVFNLRAAMAIRQTVADLRPDAVLVTTIDEWPLACMVRTAGVRPRLVLVRFMVLPLSRPLRWLARRCAAAVVAASDAVGKSLLDAGIPAALVSVIRVPHRFPPRSTVPTLAERQEARQALGLPVTGHWMAFFGGLSVDKGITDLLTALRLVNLDMPCTHLLLCGRADTTRDADRLEQWAAKFDVASRVHFLGEVGDVRPVMTAADVVVVATRAQLGEALPLTLLEAMACGTPVLGTAVGGVPEAIGSDGHAGRLARPDDPQDLARVLIELLANPSQAAQLAATALHRVGEHFDPDAAADQYEQLLRG